MELDPAALVRGVVVAAVICVPAALVGLWASDDDDIGWLATFCVALVLAGLVLGGAVAAHHQRVGSPLSHGILAAGVLFVIVQGIGLLRRCHQRRRDRVEPGAVERRPRAGGGRHRRRDRRPHGQCRRP